ncbi:MAG: glycosyltransferase [Planctomycetia bacterium]|nr:glycosyltransferase [Planctomycetia bacterium]
MPPRRLLFLLYELSFGGVERQAQLLAEAAKSQGHHVTLLVLGGDGPAHPRFTPICEQIIILHAPVNRDMALHQAIRQAVQPLQHDAAFLFSTAKLPVISHALRSRIPMQIMHVGNPTRWSWMEYFKQSVRSLYFRPSRQLFLVANSRYTLQSLNDHFYYQPFPLSFSLNCVRIPDTPVSIRETCEPLRIGMVARLDRIKDHATLLRAVALARKQGVNVVCELLGRGELEEELKKLSVELGLEQAVRFIGWSADVDSTMRQWDIFVFSTTEQEGFGNAAAEAMAAGLPCILTDIGPCREVGGDAVRYVPFANPQALADAIIALQSPVIRRDLSTRARARAQKYFRADRKLADFLRIAFASRGAA